MADNRKKTVQQQRQLNVGTAAEQLGVNPNRIPHGTGNVGRKGSNKAETHDRGNRQAIQQAEHKVVQEKYHGNQAKFEQDKKQINRDMKSQQHQQGLEQYAQQKEKEKQRKQTANYYRAMAEQKRKQDQ